MADPRIPKLLYVGEGWRIIEQIDGKIHLNINQNSTQPTEIAVTRAVISIELPKDLIKRIEGTNR